MANSGFRTHIASAVLEPDDIWVRGELDDDVRRQIDRRVGGDAVQNERQRRNVSQLIKERLSTLSYSQILTHMQLKETRTKVKHCETANVWNRNRRGHKSGCVPVCSGGGARRCASATCNSTASRRARRRRPRRASRASSRSSLASLPKKL